MTASVFHRRLLQTSRRLFARKVFYGKPAHNREVF